MTLEERIKSGKVIQDLNIEATENSVLSSIITNKYTIPKENEILHSK